MKNQKSTLILLGCALVAALAGCRSGNNSPTGATALILNISKNAPAAVHTGTVNIYLGTTATGTPEDSCNDTCGSGVFTFDAGTTVTLEAVPTAGTTPATLFNGWSGFPDCPRDGGTCTITVPTGNLSIVANFGPAATLGNVIVLTPTNKLVSFDDSAPAVAKTAVDITGLLANETIVGIDYVPTSLTNTNPINSTLIAVSRITGGTGRIFAINPNTGVVFNTVLVPARTLAAAASDTTDPFTGLSGTRFGIDFNPEKKVVRVVSDTGQNLSIELGLNAGIPGGAVTTDGALNDATTSAAVPGVVAAAYTNNYHNAPGTILYTLSQNTRRLYVQNNATGALHDIGPVSLPSGTAQIADFDMRRSGLDLGGTNPLSTEFLMVTSGGAGVGSSLYFLDVASGDVRLVSGPVLTAQIPVPVNGANANPLSEGVVALAMRPVTTPTAADVLAINEDNQLISFNRLAPNTILSRNAIPRLYSPASKPARDHLVGFDFRSSNGLLYGVSVEGRLYTINPDSGLGSFVGSLGVALSGSTDYGVDFNPVNGLLRVVSGGGQNLVVNPDTGVATSQTGLRRSGGGAGSARLTASAYGNNLPAAAKTVLYGIDTSSPATPVLVTQDISSGASVGTITNVGSGLGVAADGANGFDIDGFSATAFAAFSNGGALRLFKINLSTGVATGAISNGQPGAGSDRIGAGTDQLIGLSLRLPRVTTYALTDAGRILTFDPTAPGVTGSDLINATVSGLAAGESLATLDYRSSDQTLYAVARPTGRIYKLINYTVPALPAEPFFEAVSDNPATAGVIDAVVMRQAATDVANPVYAPGNLTDPTGYASDFRPGSTEIVHLVATGGDSPALNLKVSLNNGDTTRDANLAVDNTLIPILGLPDPSDPCNNLSSDPVEVGGMAYSNLGTAETLYVLANEPNCLYVANAGTGLMSAVGEIDVGLQSNKLGLDIVGPTDGQVLAALDVTGARSTLYTIDLANGDLTDKGLIGATDGVGKVISLTTAFLPSP